MKAGKPKGELTMKETKYAGTQTEKNLMTAFAGESEARNKYTYFASKAKKEGRGFYFFNLRHPAK